MTYSNNARPEGWALAGLIHYSPMFLFVSMVLSFILMFLVQLFYYSTHVFGENVPGGFSYIIGFSIGLITQLARLAFGLAGAYDFAKGRVARGLSGMLFSLGLAIFEAFEVAEIATLWGGSSPTLYNSTMLILQSIVWLGLLLEVRLAINLTNTLSIQEPVKVEEPQKVKPFSFIPEQNHFSSNGTDLKEELSPS